LPYNSLTFALNTFPTGEIGNDSANTTVAWVDDSTGNMNLAGNKIAGDCSGAPAGSFRVHDDNENIVSFVSNNGTLCVEGDVYENAEI